MMKIGRVGRSLDIGPDHERHPSTTKRNLETTQNLRHLHHKINTRNGISEPQDVTLDKSVTTINLYISEIAKVPLEINQTIIRMGIVVVARNGNAIIERVARRNGQETEIVLNTTGTIIRMEIVEVARNENAIIEKAGLKTAQETGTVQNMIA